MSKFLKRYDELRKKIEEKRSKEWLSQIRAHEKYFNYIDGLINQYEIDCTYTWPRKEFLAYAEHPEGKAENRELTKLLTKYGVSKEDISEIKKQLIEKRRAGEKGLEGYEESLSYSIALDNVRDAMKVLSEFCNTIKTTEDEDMKGFEKLADKYMDYLDNYAMEETL